MNLDDIKSAIRFVENGVGDAKSSEALRCFKIESGKIYASNGTVTFCAPIPLEFDANPNADCFSAAIENCEDNFNLGFDGSKIIVRSGKFSAKVDCVEQGFIAQHPTGQCFQIGQPIAPALRLLQPFIGTDPNRIWSNSVLFKGKSAYATCNAIMVEHWIGAEMPIEFSIPEIGVKELLRIKEEPAWVQADEESVTLHFSGERWVRFPQYGQKWPEIRTIFAMSNWNDITESPEELFKAMKKLKGFATAFSDAKIQPGKISVGEAAMEVDGLSGTARVPWKFLSMLDGVAAKLSFAQPLRIRFVGKGFRGLLAGKP